MQKASETAEKTILVADDEPNLRRVLGAILKREGHKVITAENGRVALEQLHDGPIHTVFTDLRMPEVEPLPWPYCQFRQNLKPGILVFTNGQLL